MKEISTTRLLPFSLLLLLQSCNPAERSLERQDYHAAFRQAARRLDGNRQKTNDLRVLEAAFAGANQRDLADIEKMKKLRGKSDRLCEANIYYLLSQMRIRHDKLHTLDPLAGSDGFRPTFQMYPVDEWERTSHQRLVQLYLRDIRANLAAAIPGNKRPAREAFRLLLQLEEKYGLAHPLAQTLADSCFLVGREHVFLGIASNPDHEGSSLVADWLNGQQFDVKDEWTKIHLRPIPGLQFDHTVHLEVTSTYVSADRTSNNTRIVNKEVEVGRKEERDSTGRVIVSEPIYCTVVATIHEICVSKDAAATAWLTVKNAHTGSILLDKKLTATNWFSDTSCNFYGDQRAVDVITCGGIYDLLDSFPSHESMLTDCSAGLKSQVLRHLKQLEEE